MLAAEMLLHAATLQSIEEVTGRAVQIQHGVTATWWSGRALSADTSAMSNGR